MNKEMKIQNKIQMVNLITQQNEKYYIPLSNLFIEFDVICTKIDVAIRTYNDFLKTHSNVNEDEFKPEFENYQREILGLTNWLKTLKNVIFTYRSLDVVYINHFGAGNNDEKPIDFFAEQLEKELKPISEQLAKMGENNNLYQIKDVDWTKCKGLVEKATNTTKKNLEINALKAAKLYAELEKLYDLPEKELD